MKTKPSIEYNRADANGARFVERPSEGLRFAGFCDDVAKANDRRRAIDHTGWFTDEFQDATIRGVVYRLPHGRYIAGYASSDDCATAPRRGSWSEPSGALLDFSDVHTDAMECALAADGIAERAAEREREYQEQWRAGADYADHAETIKNAWRKLKQLARDRLWARRSGQPDKYPAICEAINDRAFMLFETIETSRATRADLFSNYGRTEGFKEGANL